MFLQLQAATGKEWKNHPSGCSNAFRSLTQNTNYAPLCSPLTPQCLQRSQQCVTFSQLIWLVSSCSTSHHIYSRGGVVVKVAQTELQQKQQHFPSQHFGMRPRCTQV